MAKKQKVFIEVKILLDATDWQETIDLTEKDLIKDTLDDIKQEISFLFESKHVKYEAKIIKPIS